MTLKKVLKEVVNEIGPGSKDIKEYSTRVKDFVKLLSGILRKRKVKAEVFVGGSFAKGTILKSDKYEADIFLRFSKSEDIPKLKTVVGELQRVLKIDPKEVHGSRDYWKLDISDKLIFEIIPVLKIKKAKDAENVTDLSYFHVSYVKKKLNEKKRKEILIAKRFCKAQGFYGAESYIQGFSGYALECLIIHYGSFEKMCREILKTREGERLVLDPAKAYKGKSEILVSLNESRTHCPIILVDPTGKERNVLAALSWESYEKFRLKVKEFLARPSIAFFKEKEFDIVEFKKTKVKGSEFVCLELKTDRQEGDIAGTKLKKVSKFIIAGLNKRYDILKEEFVYSGGQEGRLYIITRSKGEIVHSGPSIKMEEHAAKFKKEHKSYFEKSGRLFSKEKVDEPVLKFLGRFIEKYRDTIKSIGVVDVKIC